MAVMTTAEKNRLRRLNQVLRRLSIPERLSNLSDDGTYIGSLGAATGITGTGWTINSDSVKPKIAFSAPDTGTGDFTLTIAAPATLGANRSIGLPEPGAGTFYLAVTTSADGT
ncbi:MAG: hypothetical protein PHU85_00550, partial [Phycisphaerae bacterium]|nr:hypothetical protein [Phycisphaerae bacterium]